MVIAPPTSRMNLHHPWLVGGDWNHGLFLMTFQKQLGWMDYSGLIDFNDVFDSVGIPTDFISIIFQRGRLKPPTSSHTVVKYTPVVKIVVNSDTDLQWIDHPFLRLDGLSCWLCHSWRGAIQLTHEGTWTKVGGQFSVCRGPAFVMPRFCNNAEITVGKSTKMRNLRGRFKPGRRPMVGIIGLPDICQGPRQSDVPLIVQCSIWRSMWKKKSWFSLKCAGSWRLQGVNFCTDRLLYTCVGINPSK